MIIKVLLWTLLISFLYAMMEIQIEGKSGWARNLPTFRINLFFNTILGGKPLTGYHLFFLLLIITIFHGAFLYQDWSLKIESSIMGTICWFFILEDFFWFVFNKHYGIKKFKKGKIAWHKRWFLGLPITYWIGMFAGVGLLYLGGK